MISRKLVRQIEQNAEKLAADLVQTIKRDPRAESYHHLPDHKFEELVLDLFQHLGHWLHSRTWTSLQNVYEKRGRQRYHDGMPLSHVVFSFCKTKCMLLDYIRSGVEGYEPEGEMEIELVFAISEFFDRVVYHIVVGYEDARRADLAHPRPSETEVLAAKRELVIRGIEVQELRTLAEEMPISRGGDVGEVSG